MPGAVRAILCGLALSLCQPLGSIPTHARTPVTTAKGFGSNGNRRGPAGIEDKASKEDADPCE